METRIFVSFIVQHLFPSGRSVTFDVVHLRLFLENSKVRGKRRSMMSMLSDE